jgi:hypothetical protein
LVNPDTVLGQAAQTIGMIIRTAMIVTSTITTTIMLIRTMSTRT